MALVGSFYVHCMWIFSAFFNPDTRSVMKSIPKIASTFFDVQRVTSPLYTFNSLFCIVVFMLGSCRDSPSIYPDFQKAWLSYSFSHPNTLPTKESAPPSHIVSYPSICYFTIGNLCIGI